MTDEMPRPAAGRLARPVALDDTHLAQVVGGATQQYWGTDDRVSLYAQPDVAMGGGNDTVLGSGLAERILGEWGNDSVDAGAGNDTVDGGMGNDTILAGTGNDSAAGGAGNDSIDAGAGNDTALGGDGNDTVLAGSGNNSVDGGAGDDFLSAYGDRFLAARGDLSAADGNDVMRGGDGRDTIYSGGGNDTLSGGSGRDSIDAGDGNDLILGNADGARDTVTGGYGSDTFVWRPSDGNDSFSGGDERYDTDRAGDVDTLVVEGVSQSQVFVEKAGASNRYDSGLLSGTYTKIWTETPEGMVLTVRNDATGQNVSFSGNCFGKNASGAYGYLDFSSVERLLIPKTLAAGMRD
jgi:Ca2+-binding RTX toxin-like protein